MMPAPMTAIASARACALRARLRSPARRRARASSRSAPLPHHQADRQLAGRVAGQRERAAVEHVDDRRVAQQQRVGGEEGVVARRSAARAAARRSARSGEQRVEAASARSTRAIQSRRGVQQLDVVGRLMRRAAPDAQRDARVVVGAALAPGARGARPSSRRREAAAALSAATRPRRGERDLVDRRAGAAQRASGALEGARDGRLEASSISVSSAARSASRRAAAGSATRRAASISCSSTASRTERVIAQTVSSVVDSGIAPSVGVSRAVFLKPTRPCSAAGMRIEPPVSEPSAAQAAPVATETAPPRGRAAGNARLSGRARRWPGWPACRGAG